MSHGGPSPPVNPSLVTGLGKQGLGGTGDGKEKDCNDNEGTGRTRQIVLSWNAEELRLCKLQR